MVEIYIVGKHKIFILLVNEQMKCVLSFSKHEQNNELWFHPPSHLLKLCEGDAWALEPLHNVSDL